MYNNYDPYRSTRLIMRNRQYVKTYLGKTITIATPIAIIAVAVISGFLSLLSFAIGMGEWLADVSRWASESYNVDFTFNLNGSSVSLVTIVTCVAMIIMYVKSRNTDPGSMPNGGITAFWVASIIALVGDIFACVVLLLLPILAIAMVSLIANLAMSEGFAMSAPDSGELALVCVLMYIIFAVMIFVILFTSISRFRFASSMRKSITTEELSAKGARPFAVMNFLSVVFGFITSAVGFGLMTVFKDYWSQMMTQSSELFDMPVIPESFVSLMIISLIASLISLAEPLLMGIFAMGYARHIKAAGKDGCNLPMPEPQQYGAPVPPSYQPARAGDNPYAVPVSTPVPPVTVPAPELSKTASETVADTVPEVTPEDMAPVEAEPVADAEEVPVAVEEAPVAEAFPAEEAEAPTKDANE